MKDIEGALLRAAEATEYSEDLWDELYREITSWRDGDEALSAALADVVGCQEGGYLFSEMIAPEKYTFAWDTPPRLGTEYSGTIQSNLIGAAYKISISSPHRNPSLIKHHSLRLSAPSLIAARGGGFLFLKNFASAKEALVFAKRWAPNFLANLESKALSVFAARKVAARSLAEQLPYGHRGHTFSFGAREICLDLVSLSTWKICEDHALFSHRAYVLPLETQSAVFGCVGDFSLRSVGQGEVFSFSVAGISPGVRGIDAVEALLFAGGRCLRRERVSLPDRADRWARAEAASFLAKKLLDQG